MKSCIGLAHYPARNFKWIIIFVFLTLALGLSAQEKQTVTGKIVDRKSNEVIAYANIRLLRSTDLTLAEGTVSDENGLFTIPSVAPGNYRLTVSLIGYGEESKTIVVGGKPENIGTISLSEKTIEMKETVVVAERPKGKTEKEKSTFFITKKMLDVSHTSTDLLKFIPGIQIDFMQNIALEGSQNILILVNGKERDRSFVSRLNPKDIDKIEVMSAAPSNYDGNVTGAINVVLKNSSDKGFSGQINAEIPTSGFTLYIFPNYNLSFGTKKLTLFTSYNGEMSYFDIDEKTRRKEWNSFAVSEIVSDQYVKQRNWSHRFHYGFDYAFSIHDQLSFYGFYNPFSNAHSGTVTSRISGLQNRQWDALKKDTDKNTRSYYSLFYKHLFNTAGHELSANMEFYHLNAENGTQYRDLTGSGNILAVNLVKPRQSVMTVKVDYTIPLSTAITLASGIKTKFQRLTDNNLPEFLYNDNVHAGYATLSYKLANCDLTLGTRAELSATSLQDQCSNNILSILPYANFNYRMTEKQNIRLSFSRSTVRPNLYQLNPALSADDPFWVRKGNPSLKPEFRNAVFVEHSIRFASNYFATRLFYNKTTDAISNLSFINDTGLFQTDTYNAGIIHQYGIQLSGSFKVGIATLNPYLRLYGTNTQRSPLAEQYVESNIRSTGLESGLSGIVSLTHSLALSFSVQYATPLQTIQQQSFCDALYFVSLEKNIGKNLKIGAISGLPFDRKFTYAASNSSGKNFENRYRGYILMQCAPIWFRVSYQFLSGEKTMQQKSSIEELENLPKKGF